MAAAKKPLLSILKKLAMWPTSYLYNRIQKPNQADHESAPAVTPFDRLSPRFSSLSSTVYSYYIEVKKF
jgi:hypothetical protein